MAGRPHHNIRNFKTSQVPTNHLAKMPSVLHKDYPTKTPNQDSPCRQDLAWKT